MALTAITLFAPSNSLSSVILIALVFALTGFPSAISWCFAGVSLIQFLNTASRLRIFNINMAILLILSVLPILKI